MSELSPAATDVSNRVIKDSGKRHTFESGMVRDTQEGKIDYSLVLNGPLFKRWAIHLTKGETKYPADPVTGQANWTKANSEAELRRFKKSALRHFMQWFNDEVDEDHAAAVTFNINGAEYTKDVLNSAAYVDASLTYAQDSVKERITLRDIPDGAYETYPETGGHNTASVNIEERYQSSNGTVEYFIRGSKVIACRGTTYTMPHQAYEEWPSMDYETIKHLRSARLCKLTAKGKVFEFV